MSGNYRVGLIVPSSNTTMETEIPAMHHSRQQLETNETFTFHSARMRMKHVNPEELKKMDIDSERCAIELSDARCDVLAYACLIAIMCQGPGYHQISEEKLRSATIENGGGAPIVSSAGALIEGIETIGAKKVAIITPYMKPLTNMVIEYLNTAGIEVVDSISLEVADNLEVGRLDPLKLIDHAARLNTKGADAVVLSACVQMPSLPAIQTVQERSGLPVLSAATSTVYKILKTLNLNTEVPNAGYLLSGKF
ncbi:Asp/Glu racemase [Bacillus sp. V3-13]|uniref:maleate cis-trans isomerase family protein n=1 Tax=Bacillus sp. V3-13 TaxID=2053728 RepID=UPI000C75897C|nr:Asp/Glu racemase [Bacillus sp. V3-13]PLR75886.1 Asp/Glu racemase [Bacillus sp. V3-13]